MFENRVLRRVLGPKRGKVNREWRKLHKEELRDLYSLTNIVRVVKIEKNEVGGVCGSYGEGESCAHISNGETRGYEATGEPQR